MTGLLEPNNYLLAYCNTLNATNFNVTNISTTNINAQAISTVNENISNTLTSQQINTVNESVSGTLTPQNVIMPTLAPDSQVWTNATKNLISVSPAYYYGNGNDSSQGTLFLSNAGPFPIANTAQVQGITQDLSTSSFTILSDGLYYINACINVSVDSVSGNQFNIAVLQNTTAITTSGTFSRAGGIYNAYFFLNLNCLIYCVVNDVVSFTYSDQSTGFSYYNNPSVIINKLTPN
jgi:hypothetical protein